MLRYVYCPIENGVYDPEFIVFDRIEDIKDFTLEYAVLDALSLEYYFSIEFH